MIKEWIVQGYRNDRWEDASVGWRDRKPSKKEARDLFKGIKDRYESIRLIEKEDDGKRVLWENADLLDQDIPIESVRD